MQIRLDVPQMFVVLRGRVRVERARADEDEGLGGEAAGGASLKDEVAHGEDFEEDNCYYHDDEDHKPLMKILKLPRITFQNSTIE